MKHGPGRIQPSRSARRAAAEAGDAAVVVSAPAEDLALIVWKRWPPPRPGVDVSGSVDVLKRFLSTDYIPDPRTTLNTDRPRARDPAGPGIPPVPASLSRLEGHLELEGERREVEVSSSPRLDCRCGLSGSAVAGVGVLVESAVRAEQSGFDSVTVPDLPAAATERSQRVWNVISGTLISNVGGSRGYGRQK